MQVRKQQLEPDMEKRSGSNRKKNTVRQGSPVDHVLSELSTMTCPFWVTLHAMAHSFTELVKAVIHVIRLLSFL